jgi:tricorn protease
MMKKLIILITLLVPVFLYAQNTDETRLLRYPNTSDKNITFTYGGNIYIAPINGGLATKLTSHIGIEQISRFSPDGNMIAFIGQYDGNQEIYTIHINGGTPRRVTYSMDQPDIADRQGPDKIIMQWSTNGKQIIYRSRMETWNVLTGKLYKINANGSELPVDIPVPKSGYASLSPDGNKMAYNRIFREYRTWKRYRGGQADDIWIYDFNTKELTNITNNSAQDIIPMWAGNKIYYLSDRENRMNLYCYALDTKETRKITDFKEFDVKFPSLGKNHISFENGGYLFTMQLDNEEIKQLRIKVIDDEITSRTELVDVSKRISNFTLAPDGKRALIETRGEIFIVPSTIPNEQSVTTNITNTSGIHERNATWSPNGEWIAYISDKTGTEEIWLMRPNGSSQTQLTKVKHVDSGAYRYELLWSPDSKYLLNADNTRNLNLIDVVARTEKVIFHSATYTPRDFSWSPDNKWIAYSMVNPQNIGIINLYSLKDEKSYQVTNEFYSSESSVFSRDGKYLFFCSDRDFNARINSLEWNHAYLEMAKIYGICLQKDANSPFMLFTDYNVPPVEEKKLSKKEKEIIEKADMIVDLENIEDRIFVLPVPVSNYHNLTTTEKKLYYVRDGTLFNFDFDDLKENEVGKYTSYTFTPDGKNVMFRSENDYYINKLAEKFNTKNGKLDLSGLKKNLNRKEEWKQVFNESWRHFAQFFYAPNMHGVNWVAERNKYAQLLSYVTHRTDLTYLIGELIGELNTGHCYVTGGEMPEVKKVGIGLLGIDLVYDVSAKMYKINKILQGQNWDNELRSPLTEPGLNVKTGNYIIAIDDMVLTQEINPYSYLVGKINSIVKLTLKSMTGTTDVFVKTIANESELRYYNWVEERRHIVDSVSNGRIGYVHIPDMGARHGLNWWAKYFYPQARKEGMIIDDRYNGGGNVSPMIIERLRRVLNMAKIGRNSESVFTIPSSVMTGPMVCLINEQSMSDGDMFPFQFKDNNLGPVIGKRSWGGVVGIYGSLPLLDGSSINKPEVANFGAKSGNWELEGVGMIPDIEVDNHPAKEYAGVDEQLLFAIDKILELMKTNTKPKVPAIPKYPIKK